MEVQEKIFEIMSRIMSSTFNSKFNNVLFAIFGEYRASQLNYTQHPFTTFTIANFQFTN